MRISINPKMTARYKTVDIKNLFYITHVENIPSILKRGIFSHSQVAARGIPYTPIYDQEIVNNRKTKLAPNGKSLWEYANLYFQPRNPMMYRVVHEKEVKHIAVLAIRPQILEKQGIFITDGNAASDPTNIFEYKEGIREITSNWKIIQSEWWNRSDGSKRQIMAECLIPDTIPPDLIQSIYVANQEVRERLLKEPLERRDVHIIPEPNMFFRPGQLYRVTNHLSLAEGDMFFSNMHTLTISVNTVGIMGKGLASRAKYQFPDVYVRYQDACRRKWLTMGKPYLYKREDSYEDELIDEPSLAAKPNGVRWFLMFATKRHWREDSDIQGIDEGLQWIANNYEQEGIKSIALPALGCGLGNLEWKDIGPLMCKRLVGLNIDVAIYLPREKDLPPDALKPEFLLK